jgi:hypothetical protein
MQILRFAQNDGLLTERSEESRSDSCADDSAAMRRKIARRPHITIVSSGGRESTIVNRQSSINHPSSLGSH